MNSIKTIIAAIALSTLSGYAQAEVLKPLQAGIIHTATKDAVAFYLADNGACKAVITITDKAFYAPARFEAVIEADKSVLHPIADGRELKLSCHADAQAMTIDLLPTIAQH